MANMLSKEIDNLIVIKSDDITSLESMISDIKKAVKDRDLQIKLKNSAIWGGEYDGYCRSNKV